MKILKSPLRYFLYFIILSTILTSIRISAEDTDFCECATCKYLSEQFARLRNGLEPIEDPSFVPEGYWDRLLQRKNRDVPNLETGVSEFPNTLYLPDTNRTDDDSDGLLECRYRIDLSNLVTYGGYTTEEKNTLEDEVRKGFNLWNTTLAYVNFEFREVGDGSEHLVVNAIDGGSWVGQTVYFGGVTGTNRLLSLNYNYSDYGAYQYLVEPATKNTLIDNPPGNPYGCLVDRNLIRFETRTWPTCTTVLHEIGHLLGLMHPQEAIPNAIAGLGYSENISWLDYPTIPTPVGDFVSSTRLGGEDVLAGLTSRGLNNSFMTYDRPYYIFYADIPPEMKGCMAHYYQSLNPGSAQTLLNLARSEHSLYSPLDDPSSFQETEPNDSTGQANSFSIGQSILGAVSSWNPAFTSQAETYGDLGDYYSFTIGASDLNKAIIFDIDHGSQFFGKRLEILDTDGTTVLAVSDDGSAVPGGYPDPGSADSGFYFYDDPYIEWTPTSSGTYYVRITRKTEQLWYGDYYLVTSQKAGTSAHNWIDYN